MKIEKIGQFTEGIGEYIITFDGDDRIEQAYNSLSIDDDYESLETDFYSGVFSDIYRNIYIQMSGGVWGTSRILVQTNRSIFSGQCYLNDSLGKAAILETCKQLHELGWYLPIIELLAGLSYHFEDHCLDDIRNVLEILEIREGYSVAQFCQDAYIQFRLNYEDSDIAWDQLFNEDTSGCRSKGQPEEITFPSDFNLYNCTKEDKDAGLLIEYISGLQEKASINKKGIIEFWMEPLFCDGSVTSNTIDSIDTLIDYLTELAYEEKLRNVIRKEHSDSVVYLAREDEEVFKTAKQTVEQKIEGEAFQFRKRAIGILYNLQSVDINYRLDAIFGILAELSCEEYDTNEALKRLIVLLDVNMKKLTKKTFMWLQEDTVTVLQNIDFIFLETNTDEDIFLCSCKGLFEKWRLRGKTIVEFMSKMKEVQVYLGLEDIKSLEIDSIILCGLIALYGSGDYDAAIDYIIENGSHASKSGFENLIWNIIITRCFSHAEDLGKANILLGMINEYGFECERTYNELRITAEEAINHISNVRRFIHNYGEMYFETNEIELELFGDEVISQTTEIVKKALLSNDRVKPYVYSDLFRYADLVHVNLDQEEYTVNKWHRNAKQIIRKFEVPEKRIVLPAEWFCTTKSYVDICEMQENQNQFINYCNNIPRIISGDILEGIRNAKLLSIKRINTLQDQEIEDTITRITDLKKALLSKDATEDQILKVLEELVEDLSERSVIKDSKWEMVEKSIQLMEVTFFERFGIVGDGSVIDKLGEKAEGLKNFLITSERVFIYLSKAGNSEKADFSAALISMTKALELVLNYIFKKVVSLNGGKENTEEIIKKVAYRQRNSYIDSFEDGKTSLKENLELWAAINLFVNNKLYDGLSIDTLVDCSRLSCFAGQSIIISDKKKEEFLNGKGGSKRNRSILGSGMHYVRKNYRNKTAHPEYVARVDAETCKKLLIQGEGLLWILLYIMR